MIGASPPRHPASVDPDSGFGKCQGQRRGAGQGGNVVPSKNIFCFINIMASFTSDNGKCSGQITVDKDNWVYTIVGGCKTDSSDKLNYVASAPATFRQSYMGSGLPYPNEEIAYDNTPNRGEAAIHNGKFSFSVISPNSYYINNGSVLVKPHVQFTIGTELFVVSLGVEPIANRSLTSLPGRPVRKAHK